ncbi:MAG: hypothetical protein GTO02_09845 [Candidatus Dadabacteria bacterium]|nr:hypothetical protein [Candidatus Dadabacteria bacterium]
MKVEFVSMYPKDDYDEVLTVRMTPRWYETLDVFDKPLEDKWVIYWGSGHQWWERATDKRADSWTSSILHDLWRNELNKRLERKNCRYA